MSDRAPNFSGEYPGAGEKIGPAWAAAWGRLSDHEWHNTDDLVSVMSAAGGVVTRTCKNLLRDARRAGLIEARRNRRPDGGHGTNDYRRKP